MTTQDITLCTLPSVFRADSASSTLGNALGVKDASIINATLPTINNQVLSGNTDGTCSWITNTGAVTSLSIDPSLSTGLAISNTSVGNYSIGAVNQPTTNKARYYFRSDGSWAQPSLPVRKSASTLIRFTNSNVINGNWVYMPSFNWTKVWDNASISIADTTVAGVAVSGWTIPAGVYKFTATVQMSLNNSTGTASTANFFMLVNSTGLVSLPPVQSNLSAENTLMTYITFGQVLSQNDYIMATGTSFLDSTGQPSRVWFPAFYLDKGSTQFPLNPNILILIEKIA